MKKVMMELRPNQTWGKLVRTPCVYVYRYRYTEEIMFCVSLCGVQAVSLQLHVSCAGKIDLPFTADEETLFA